MGRKLIIEKILDFIKTKVDEQNKGKWKTTKNRIVQFALNDVTIYIIADISLEYSLFYQKLNVADREYFKI